MTELTVASDLRGNVWAVLVKAGEAVDAGQELLVLEVMKTEIPVVAPVAGTVLQILVKEGESVDERQPLLQLGG